MIEFNTEGKINFVDNNDVLVGFSLVEHCCEYFGWFYSLAPPKSIDDADVIEPENLENYIFDSNFFQEVNDEAVVHEGGMVTFKLTNEQKVLYLSLFNTHNGHYTHGFHVTVSGKNLNEGAL